MMTIASAGHRGKLHGLRKALHSRSLSGPSDSGVEEYSVQFNTGIVPYDMVVARITDLEKVTLKKGTVARVYFGQLGSTSLPLSAEGQKLYLLEVAPQGPKQFWGFYRDSDAAQKTIASGDWAADTPARNERTFWTVLKPSQLDPYDPSKVVDSYTGAFGPDDRGLEDAVGKGASKKPKNDDGSGTGSGTGTKVIGGSPLPGGAGAGGGSGGSGSGGIDIGIPGLGLGPNWKLPDLGSGLLILLLIVGGGLLLTNKAVK